MIDVGLIIGYILFGLAVLGAFAFPVMYMIKHPKEAKMTVMGIGGMLVLFFIAWLLSDSEVTEKYTKLNVGAGQSRMISAGLITAYIVAFATIVFTVGSTIRKAITNR